MSIVPLLQSKSPPITWRTPFVSFNTFHNMKSSTPPKHKTPNYSQRLIGFFDFAKKKPVFAWLPDQLRSDRKDFAPANIISD